MLPQQLVDRILSCAPYLPTRATCKKQCDRLTNILSDSFPALDRPRQLRRAVVDGDFTKMRMLLDFGTDPDAFVVEEIENAFIAVKGDWRMENGEMVFDDDLPVVFDDELAAMGGSMVRPGMGLRWSGNMVRPGDTVGPPVHVYYDLPPSTPLVAAAVLGKHAMVGAFLRAGVRFHPVVWLCQRAIQNRRRGKEDLRRSKEDQRRAEEDRRREKEDRRRAKEDARRSRQYARMKPDLATADPATAELEESEAESPDPATANVRPSEVPDSTSVVQIVEHVDNAADIPPDEAQQLVAFQETGWVHRLIGFAPCADPEIEKVFFGMLGRKPKEVNDALVEGVPLASVRDELRSMGMQPFLSSGVSIFVDPRQYGQVIRSLSSKLHWMTPASISRIVVFSESTEHLVAESLSIAAVSGAWLGDLRELETQTVSTDPPFEEAFRMPMQTQNTFIHFSELCEVSRHSGSHRRSASYP
mmetsp:Transcript_47925/g.95340  ORF Transcript_47925/g.95340 Transcript_47925/m.95340 type:complete len:472 (-) Transcript_47925:300-1715(-)